ncbi:hypothetical protein LTR91_005511 [Friedmanniomyces endolithicus]|uniref:Uncharacterized protein n=1 Tax=Friedmanniomyces endolithicus TaxID=329885 RepID=A0AAN6FUA4_9PEZI|nr:hypothetical protein LTR35_008482 [Friedmanniomyces endolithicus]KAK0294767.1 hypothetical protein LTS00_006602 [Friedmanniomyces endolithicus]KAK0322466.1 hypothetical protein LTR82_006425 [Friedmanniomyces endolithicus]KAK0922018.1 hypothetical protein LTR57_008162 [Friedmanniomyces endolithicus]KAK0972732.1 hypothetical protein LTS01_014806 [Friedmanniomyces endolithicus]
MSEQEPTLCEFQDCKQPNPRIEIDRIRRETNFLKTKGDEFHQDLFASIKELKTMPASLDQVFVQAEIEAALKERLRALQTRMTVVCEKLRKVEQNNHAHLVMDLPTLHDNLREAGKHFNMWKWHAAEHEVSAEKRWQGTRRWHWVESSEAKRVESKERARVAGRWPRLGEVGAEGLVAGMEMDGLD